MSSLLAGARGGVLTISAQVLKLIINFVSLTVLSRMLDPEDFGLIAMVSVVIALGNLLSGFGLPTAALQSRFLSRQQSSNLFWISTSVGVFVGGGMAILAPWISSIYSEPRLTPIVFALSFMVVVSASQSQIQVMLARNMKFGVLAATEVVASALALTAAIIAAATGLDYWSLVLQSVLAPVLLLAMRWIALRWLPDRPARDGDTRRLVVSGAEYGGAQLLSYAASNSDSFVIGLNSGAEALGYYNRAFQLLMAPIQTMLSPLTNVVIPMVHRARSENRSPDELMARVQFAVALPTIMIFAVAVPAAPLVIPIVLGSGWDPSIALFQILALGGAVQVLSYVSYWGFIIYEQSRQLLFYNLLTKSLSVVAVIAASFHGVASVAWAYSLVLAVSWPINLIWLWRTAGQRSSLYWWNGIRVLAAGVVAACVGLVVSRLLERLTEQPLVSIVVAVTASLVAYSASIIVFPKGRQLLISSMNIYRAAFRR